MADISRAMNTPPPAAQQPQATPQPAAPPSTQRIVTVPDDVKAAAIREQKNERARLQRKAKRAADAKAAALEAARPKKKKLKKRKLALGKALDAAAGVASKKRRRGRPPGAKNKPKAEGLAVALVPAPGVLPRGRATAEPRSVDALSVFFTLRDMMRALPPAQRVQILTALVNDK